MENEIVRLISKFIPLTEHEITAVTECIPVRKYKKGTILLREGQIATECYFNLKGIVRQYYLFDGEEKTTYFFTEEESIASLTSYVNKVPANHYFSCVEDCTLAVLTYEHEQELCKRVSKFETLCKYSIEGEFGKQQQVLSSFIMHSPKERYLHLLQTRPELMNRVPQHQLASYLGVKPESLSRIRKRIATEH
ncbi:Crp/Fnr family transcriptional regulator [Chondrinema litorale]|uniref:Crp/Fnr family transcriptional regulator n=1 Tax=Chondrinema litorale TaxID=2994555 RepID=UPI00254277D5|nr:Crp/Fnr family transcriptional regulator [Chondrinema litorale]UZR97924.1 Crp/Fnr family transcriptional regulator [Chondrinema litorale]